MAKEVYFGLGDDVLNILKADRARKAAAKRRDKWCAQQVAEGNYFEYDNGVYMAENGRGELFDVTEYVEAQQDFEDSLEEFDDDEFSLDDLVLDEDELMTDDEEDINEEDLDDDDDPILHVQELVQAVFRKTLDFLYDYTPVDTGNLIDSIYTQNDGIAFKIGFDMNKAPYAVRQHEDLSLNHVNGTAKFLEKALTEALLLIDQDQELTANIEIHGISSIYTSTLMQLNMRGVGVGMPKAEDIQGEVGDALAAISEVADQFGIQTGTPTLEVQVNYSGLDNISSDIYNTEQAMQIQQHTFDADFNFDHDFAADMNALSALNTTFDVNIINSINNDLVASAVRNRRMNSKLLGKVDEETLIDLIKQNHVAGDTDKMSIAYAAYLLKHRTNYRKAFAKFKYLQTRK